MQDFAPGVRMPYAFPYGKPEDLSFVPLNPYGARPQQPIAKPGDGPHRHTTDPILTGTSVLAILYRDGVMISADTLASYGSLARFRTMQRIEKVGQHTVIGATGDLSDFQYLIKALDELNTENDLKEDGSALSPKAIHSYLTRLLYNRRNQFNPLWGQFIVGGFENGKPFLGLADMRGTSFVDEHIATGYGAYIAHPLLRKGWRADLTEAEARKLLEDSMRVLFYRDARTYNRMQIATVTEKGVFISEPYALDTDWTVGNKTYPQDPEVTNLPNL